MAAASDVPGSRIGDSRVVSPGASSCSGQQRTRVLNRLQNHLLMMQGTVLLAESNDFSFIIDSERQENGPTGIYEPVQEENRPILPLRRDTGTTYY
jgi:hypothetical protein